MSSNAAPGGVDGQIYGVADGALLTFEPTNPGDAHVDMWLWVDGREYPGRSLTSAQLRGVAADLRARAEVIDGGGQ